MRKSTIDPIELPETVPELIAIIRAFEADLADRRERKRLSMERWRAKVKTTDKQIGERA